MIASTDKSLKHPRVAGSFEAREPQAMPDSAVVGTANAIKHWVAANPAAAVVSAAVLGLAVGYFVKRR